VHHGDSGLCLLWAAGGGGQPGRGKYYTRVVFFLQYSTYYCKYFLQGPMVHRGLCLLWAAGGGGQPGRAHELRAHPPGLPHRPREDRHRALPPGYGPTPLSRALAAVSKREKCPSLPLTVPPPLFSPKPHAPCLWLPPSLPCSRCPGEFSPGGVEDCMSCPADTFSKEVHTDPALPGLAWPLILAQHLCPDPGPAPITILFFVCGRWALFLGNEFA